MKSIRTLTFFAALLVSVGLLAGCESDDKVEHKVTFHNLSSYTVTQRVSTDKGDETLTLEPGKKAAFGGSHGETIWFYPDYSPSKYVVRSQEDSHTMVYKDR